MKSIVKTIAQLIFALLALPLVLLYWLFSTLGNKNAVLASFSQLLSLLPGMLGVYFRAGFYRFTLSHCSPDAVISFATLLCQQNISVHQGVYIGPQCNIGKCEIGKDTLLGSGVHIMSGKGQHNIDDSKTPIKHQGGSFTKVKVGENCWLGNGALIMADVGNNSVVAAGAVVINDVPSNSIVAGNPATVIKKR